MKNQFGLSRHIPTAVALEIRQKSKFGCVNCRCAFYVYEHIDPEFHEATTHDPEKICLLCAKCHDKVTRKQLSKETIKAKYLEVQNSVSIKRPFDDFDLSTNSINIKLGGSEFKGAQHLLKVNGKTLIDIAPPKEGAKFPTLSGIFCDKDGKEILHVDENVWQLSDDAWDMSIVGRLVTIKSSSDRIALQFEVEPPDGLSICHLDMYQDGCHIFCNKDSLAVGRKNAISSAYLHVSGFVCTAPEIGIDIDSSLPMPRVFHGLEMVGGQGIKLNETGIRIGIGSRGLIISQLSVWIESNSELCWSMNPRIYY